MVSLMKGSMVFCFTLANRCRTTCPPRSIMPKTSGFSFSIVPRPVWLLRRRRRPLRSVLFTTSGCPLGPATTEASSHSTSLERITAGFFYHATTQRSRPLIGIPLIEGPLVGNVLIRQIQPHKIQTQYPHFQRLMMSSKDGVGPVIKACVTVVALRALTGRFRVIKAPRDDVCGLTRGTHDAVGPAQLTNRLITLDIIDEMLDVDLHGWTPVRARGRGCRQYTPSSHATTLESKKSVKCCLYREVRDASYHKARSAQLLVRSRARRPKILVFSL